MATTGSPSRPRARPSLIAWSLLVLVMVAGSYPFTFLLAAACFYFPYMLATSNSAMGLRQYTVMAAICGPLIGLVLLWSMLPRRENTQAPGPRLEPSEHPRLFAEIAAIAQSLAEAPPEEIYLTGDLNAFAAEWRDGPGGNKRRTLALGLPLMHVLTIAQFSAVVAHEFAHYYSGDTRLGPLSYRSRAAMARALRSLTNPSLVKAMNRGAKGWTLAIGYAPVGGAILEVVTRLLLGYWKLFLKATQFVSRRQEYRADELACRGNCRTS